MEIIQAFFWHPERIAIVSGIFFLSFLGACVFYRKQIKFRHFLLLACAAIWAMYAMWEAHCKTMGYDIRVDLLFISPVLIGSSIFTILVNFINL